jgi:hypothetical protein
MFFLFFKILWNMIYNQGSENSLKKNIDLAKFGNKLDMKL